jgi:predicted nucleic acid-binding protein
MSSYLLDTSVIIDTLNAKHNRHALLRGLLEAGHVLGCCAVNVAEVFAGMRPKEETATERFLHSLEYYDVTWGAARRAGLFRRDYARIGLTLSITDATIAAVALEHALILITDNAKDFPMRDLVLYSLP